MVDRPATTGRRADRDRSELAKALLVCRNAFIAVAGLSGLLNILMLTGSFFMLLVYDTVLPSHSLPTLVGLLVLVAVLYGFQGILDLIRSRMLVQIAAVLDISLTHRVYDAIARMPLRTRAVGDGLMPLRDLDAVRNFLGGLGPTAFCDLPWMVIYIAVCFLFHPLIGFAALAGAVILISLALLTEHLTREPIRASTGLASQRNALAETTRRNAEAVQALGMRGRLEQTWDRTNTEFLKSQQRASDVAGGLNVTTKTFRMLLQSVVLAIGAYLVIEQKATGGVIIASSILSARALAPVELAIGHWRGFVAARQSWKRLSDLFGALTPETAPTPLPSPKTSLKVEQLSVAPPGSRRIVLEDTSFDLMAGDALGVIGPSASGKSTLGRALVGVWRPFRGKVRLDGAALEQWDSDELGAHLGYLPQDVELMSGTVAQNIARFETDPSAEAVIAAAKAAHVHDLVLRLPDGYETAVGQNGAELSAGQRQRIALARALYREPFLVVLDEPNSNLDVEGEQALGAAIAGARARGGIVVVIAHRPSVLAAVNVMLILGEGRVQAFGPKDQVMAKLGQPRPVATGPQPLRPAGVEGRVG